MGKIIKAEEILAYFYGKIDINLADALINGLKAVGVDVSLNILEQAHLSEDVKNYSIQYKYRLDIKNKKDGSRYSAVI